MIDVHKLQDHIKTAMQHISENDKDYLYKLSKEIYKADYERLNMEQALCLTGFLNILMCLAVEAEKQQPS